MAVEKVEKRAKTKVIAKTGGVTMWQWDIMKMMMPGKTGFCFAHSAGLNEIIG